MAHFHNVNWNMAVFDQTAQLHGGKKNICNPMHKATEFFLEN